MTQLIPFAFEDHLVRVFKPNGEPWFVGRDVCAVLEIRNESDALARLDPDERDDGVAITDPIGREQKVICVSEAGVYRLVFTSRKPQAERFKRWLAHEVLPKLRRDGFYALPGAEAAAEAAGEGPLAAMNAKVGLIREARLLYGPERARALWPALGLPAVPEAPTPVEEARACLMHLLNQPKLDRSGSVRELVEDAFGDSADADRTLRNLGLRVVRAEREGLIVANINPWVLEAFVGTAWSRGRHREVLRRLPGAGPAGRHAFAGTQHRSTFIPIEVFDTLPLPEPAEPRALVARTH